MPDLNPDGTPVVQTPASDPLGGAELRTILSGMVNQAVKKSLADIGPTLKTLLEAELAPLRESLKAAPQAPKETPVQEDKSKSAGQQQAPEDPRVAALLATAAEQAKALEKLTKDHREAKAETARERRAAIEMKGYQDLQQALAGKVRPEAMQFVIAGMRGQGQVVIDDTGNVFLKQKVSPGLGMPEEEINAPLAEAIPRFLKTPEAALFIPPPTSGAGTQGRKPPGSPDGTSVSAVPKPNDPIGSFEATHGNIDSFL